MRPGSVQVRKGELQSKDQTTLEQTSRQGSLNPPVAGTGSLNPGSDNPRVASPRTNGSSVSVLAQEPEAAGVADLR